MTGAALIEMLACPICLEPSGCAACGLPEGNHASCVSSYVERARCACGGPDKVRLQPAAVGFVCPCCRARYAFKDGVLDLTPRQALGDGTLYADHEFHERLVVADNPLLLSARIKARQMLRMLRPAPGARVLDLGCGSGRFALFAAERGLDVVGLDFAPFFLPRAVARVDLVLGDLRRLPFRKSGVDGAYCLDVLEHLHVDGVREVLVEARRVLRPGGRLLVYTHAMESSSLARFQRGVNHLARRLGRRGLLDAERERLRKSDHRNAIRSHEHFEALARDAGLAILGRRYYNVVFKAVIEDLGLRLFEQLRRTARTGGAVADQALAPGPADTRPERSYGRFSIANGRLLTELLELDVRLFGRIRTGPFFGLLAPLARTGARPGGEAS
jgi:ubiquinone/menaquinone biosynthesis C-methylase UbiE